MTETAAAEPFVLDNSYARLPSEFHARAMPTAVAAARLIRVNRPLAEQLGQRTPGASGFHLKARLLRSRAPERDGFGQRLGVFGRPALGGVRRGGRPLAWSRVQHG